MPRPGIPRRRASSAASAGRPWRVARGRSRSPRRPRKDRRTARRCRRPPPAPRSSGSRSARRIRHSRSAACRPNGRAPAPAAFRGSTGPTWLLLGRVGGKCVSHVRAGVFSGLRFGLLGLQGLDLIRFGGRSGSAGSIAAVPASARCAPLLPTSARGLRGARSSSAAASSISTSAAALGSSAIGGRVGRSSLPHCGEVEQRHARPSGLARARRRFRIGSRSFGRLLGYGNRFGRRLLPGLTASATPSSA